MNLKQCVSAAMAAAMTLSATATPALAAVDESPGVAALAAGDADAALGDQSAAEEDALSAAGLAEKSHQDTKVYASAYGSYTLTVPESINLHNLEKSDLGSGLYVNNEHCRINLRGDVRENQIVVVTVTEPVMQSKGSADVDATVDTSSKTIWSRDDMFTGAVDNGDGTYSEPTGTSTVYPVSAELTPGDWTGTAMFNCSLEIAPSIAGIVTGLDSSSFDYDGNAHAPGLVFVKGAALVEGRDYELSGNTSETEEGNYSITITGKGKYVGSQTFNWKIKRYGLGSDVTASLDKSNFVADGLEHAPNIVWGSGSDLREGIDYDISGTRAATVPGNYTITITGKGKYKGTLTLDWSITATDISNIIEGLDASAFEEDGTTHAPKIIWRDGYSLVSGTDYDISGTTSSAVGGDYTITITGKGKYAGTITLDWKITAKPDIALAITGLTPTHFDYDEAEHAPEFVFAEGYKNLVEGVDYTVTGTRNATDCGDYHITVTGIGHCKGSATFDWNIRELIPVGGTYTVYSTGERLVGDGETVYFPLHMSLSDEYVDDNYRYYYWNTYWTVQVRNRQKEVYPAIRSYVCDKKISSLSNTFSGCSLLTEAPVIPDSVKNMSGTFYGCSSLTEAPVIPDSVTDMSYTFYGCSSLTEAPTIPDNVKDMSGTFRDCTSLTKAPAIPDGVTSMIQTFYNCSLLTEVPAIPDSVTNMENTFAGCQSLMEAPKISASAINMSCTFASCKALIKAPEIPNGVENMDSTFLECNNLTVFPSKIPDSVKNMYRTFQGCTKLTDVPVISKTATVTDMGSTFSSCSLLTKAPIIPDSVKNMSSTFYGCSSLTEAPVIPDSVTDMSYTFYGCSSLTEAPVIPDSVTNMRYTFCGCKKLVKAPIISETATVINMYSTFYYCNSLTESPFIPDSVTNMGRTFLGCSSVNNPHLKEGAWKPAGSN